MDVTSRGKYPSNKLSNFAAHPFEMDGVKIASMEGFLQALKFSGTDMQEHVCSLAGIAAKKKGANKKWFKKQVLYWRGEPIMRDSKGYQDLLDRAYEECARQSESFRRALRASGNSTLTHSIGRKNISETVLTQTEFCSRLMKIRQRVLDGEFDQE